jgi:hypothetical protein
VGLVVAVAAPAEAAMPVSEGNEKYVPSHAAGAAAVIVASLVKVTVKVPLPATVRGVANVCAVPDDEVAKFHVTPLGVVDRQPVCVVASADVVYPFAYTVFAGRLTAVRVTGKVFGFVIVATTSPVPPGNSWFVAEGVATAVMVRLLTVADWPSPEDPALSPTTQLVTPYAAPPTMAIPARPDTTLKARDRPPRWNLECLVVRFVRVCFIVSSP